MSPVPPSNPRSFPSPPPPSTLPSPPPQRLQLVNSLLPLSLKLSQHVCHVDAIANSLFNRDAGMQMDHSLTLLNKMSESLWDIDIDVKQRKEWMHSCLVRCNISNPSYHLLVDFSKYVKEMHRVTVDLSEEIVDELGRVMDERRRGFISSSPSPSILPSIKQMSVAMQRALSVLQNRSHA